MTVFTRHPADVGIMMRTLWEIFTFPSVDQFDILEFIQL